MKLLLTSDWQTETTNIDLCSIALDELLAAAELHQPEAIIHAGDAKEQYDPVNLAVLDFWMKAVRRIRKAGYRFMILLGNHDRSSQSPDSINWFSAFRAAGAEVFSKPKTVMVGEAIVAMLPYTGDREKEKVWAAKLWDEVHDCGARHAVCIYHTELRGAFMNAAGRLGGGNSLEDLFLERYDAALGGHFHGHQRVSEAVWYIGSPFCHGWGEVNEPKGHVLLTLTGGGGPRNARGVKVQHIRTAIPGWYDKEWLEENKITPEPGAYIRSKVQVTQKKLTRQIREEEQQLKEAYPDARLFVVPDVQDDQELDITLTGTTDQEHIEQYVAATRPKASGFNSKAAVEYLAQTLGAAQPRAVSASMRVVSAVGSDVLCFESVKIKYGRQGLVLLRGVNRDWPKRSNGAGKTSALSLLPIAMFGETLKGQRNDQWAREGSSNGSVCRLLLKDQRNRKIEIIRCRPHSLELLVDDKPYSVGITGKGKTETQGEIIRLTGFDLQMLQNSVYIDQAIANGFLFGTQKDRMDLVAKLVDLERYEKALKLVKADIVSLDVTLNEKSRLVARLTEQITQLELEVEQAGQQKPKSEWAQKLKEAEAAVEDAAKTNAAVAGSGDYYAGIRDELADIRAETPALERRVSQARAAVMTADNSIAQAKKLIQAKKCPTCGQDAVGVGKDMLKLAEDVKRQGQEALTDAEEQLARKRKQREAKEKEISTYDTKVIQAKFAAETARQVLASVIKGRDAEAAYNAEVAARLHKATAKLQTAKLNLETAEADMATLEKRKELLMYAAEAFKRDGMPLYLAASLCPVLNKAAREYSDIFTDGKLRIHFSVQGEKFDVSVVNPAGSQTTDGQSVGESAMAGLITAFSIREVTPKTNLLILDEPGHGLDTEGARQFARGLLRLRDRFETIILTTHSSTIQELLEGEAQVWTVEKRNGVSQLLV